LILTAVGGGGAAGVGRGLGTGVAVARAAGVGETDAGGAVDGAIGCAVVDAGAEIRTDGVAAASHPTSITPSSTTATVMRNPIPPSSPATVRPSELETRPAGHCFRPDSLPVDYVEVTGDEVPVV
jgi:hypothetical protein